MSLPPALTLYRAGVRLLKPFAPALLKSRAGKGKEDPERLDERLGRPDRARPEAPLVWMHGASVGESLVLLTLAEALLAERDDLHILVTTGTTTSAALMAARLPARAFHQYVPIDDVAAARAFLDHWRPGLAVFAESELWPNLLIETRARSVPTALVNARMNRRSLDGWRSRRRSAQTIIGGFDWIGAADARTAKGLSELAGRDVARAGNLKLEARPVAPDPARLEAVRDAVGGRPVWLAASTHAGEEGVLLSAHQYLLERDPRSLLILAPRHPERGEEIAELAQDRGLALARRSKAETPDGKTPVWLADTLGEMPLWFALCSAAFIGGSLVDGIGGHNPIEASRAGAPVITGAFTASFDDVYAAYDAEDARAVISDALELAEAVAAAIDHGAPHPDRAEAAIARASGGALETTLAALRPLLPAAEDKR